MYNSKITLFARFRKDAGPLAIVFDHIKKNKRRSHEYS
jgi:hypothetical protein